MTATYLITGGAGFIGSHLADELLAAGHCVRVLDGLVGQVHGDGAERPSYLDPEVECVVGDVRDAEAVGRALNGVDGVFHLAALVGVGQSMYEIDRYTAVNDLGTAVLLQQLLARPVRRLVVASSMSVYGEGLYRDADGRHVSDAERDAGRVGAGRWELRDGEDRPLVPLPTPESKPPCLGSVYALTKFTQERLALIFGRAYGVETTALRLFNVYGTRQALSNPYTGVLAIFASRLLNGRPPLVFEDGEQRRDFVAVADVARAFRLAMDSPGAPGRVFNVGSGRDVSVREVAETLARALGVPHILPEITGKARAGDIRHCFADITSARDGLGFTPQESLAEGVVPLVAWLARQTPADRVPEAHAELVRRGLVA